MNEGGVYRISLVAQMVKCLPTVQENRVQSVSREDLLEKEMVTHSSILAWKIPWAEEPGRLQSMGLQRVGHDWATSLSLSRVRSSWGGGLHITKQHLWLGLQIRWWIALSSILGGWARMPCLLQLAITQASHLLCFSCSGAKLSFYLGSLQAPPTINYS